MNNGTARRQPQNRCANVAIKNEKFEDKSDDDAILAGEEKLKPQDGYLKQKRMASLGTFGDM